ncbi:MAG: restriction endonuclease subunit S [Victivallales bacterium]|nr:restriction endonuclease subunit S [Victivallales bacterium]
MSSIPEGWRIYYLDNFIEKVLDFRGRTPKKLGMEWGNGNIRALSANNVRMGWVDFQKECYVGSEELYDKWMTKGQLECGDILLTMEAPLGNVAQVPDNQKYILSQRVIALKTKPTIIDNDFLKQAMTFEVFQRMLIENSTGSTATGIQQKRLIQLELLLPPLSEQKKIAEILSSVDRSIEATQKLIAKLSDLKKALMQELFTKGIGHTRFKDSPLGRIPEEWEVVSGQEICHSISVGIVIKPTQYYDIKGTIPLLRSANVSENGIINSNFVYTNSAYNQTLQKSILKYGDVVTVRTGYPGTSCVIPPDYAGSNCIDLIISRPNNDVVSSYYYALWINSDIGKGQVFAKQGGLAQQHFNVGELKELKILLPSLDEQNDITSILLAEDKKIEKSKSRLEKLKDLKKGLMQDLLTGKVRV